MSISTDLHESDMGELLFEQRVQFLLEFLRLAGADRKMDTDEKFYLSALLKELEISPVQFHYLRKGLTVESHLEAKSFDPVQYIHWLIGELSKQCRNSQTIELIDRLRLRWNLQTSMSRTQILGILRMQGHGNRSEREARLAQIQREIMRVCTQLDKVHNRYERYIARIREYQVDAVQKNVFTILLIGFLPLILTLMMAQSSFYYFLASGLYLAPVTLLFTQRWKAWIGNSHLLLNLSCLLFKYLSLGEKLEMEEEYEQRKDLAKQLFCAYLSLSEELTKEQLRARLKRLPLSVFESILEELVAEGSFNFNVNIETNTLSYRLDSEYALQLEIKDIEDEGIHQL